MSATVFKRNSGRRYPYFSEADVSKRESDVESVTESDRGRDSFSETSSLMTRMKALFEKQIYTDVTFYAKSNRNLSFSAHRAVLASESRLFAEMLFENQDSRPDMTIEISNISFKIFRIIVKYLYTDELPPEDDLLSEVYEAACLFSIRSLEDKCLHKLERSISITEGNVCSLLQTSIEKKCELLKNRCCQFIQDNTLAVLDSPGFEELPIGIVVFICGLPVLNLHSEVQVFQAVLKWVCSSRAASARSFGNSLLKKIRFLTLSANEFANIISEHKNVMTQGDALKIMMYLSKKDARHNFLDLPKWCNRITESRCRSQAFLKVQEPRLRPLDSAFEIPLKSAAGQTQCITDLSCMLNLQCTGNEKYEITAVRLSFQEPVCEKSVIDDLVIKLCVMPKRFQFQETVRIQKSTFVRVQLSKVPKMSFKDNLQIVAEARGINLYKFLQLGGGTSTQQGAPFSYFASSIPSTGQLFFISGIEYRSSAIRQ